VDALLGAMTGRTMARILRRPAVDIGEVMDDAQAEYTWFYRTEFRAVVQTAYLVLHDRQQAEDVAQEASRNCSCTGGRSITRSAL
jgi:hypothetical protein